MSTKHKYTKEETNLFETIHSAIREQVENKVTHQIKSGHHKIDESAIRKKMHTRIFP